MITALETYKLFLEGIKKESISTVPPDIFNNLINKSQLKVILSKLPETEVINKRVEDLSQLLVTLDTENYPAIETISPNSNAFRVPRMDSLDINEVNYPQELKILNVGFKMQYYGHRCFPDGLGEDFEMATLMKTDQRYQILKNPHRFPTLGPPNVRVYFQVYQDKIRAVIARKSTESYARYLKLEYYRYPVEFFFDKNNPDGGTPLEFRNEMVHEIVDHAVLSYIERIQDPRFQTKKIENREDEINS
ncbi:MAG: hypothetical protein ACLFT4_00160 [Bacteroidales bacterium]